MVLTVNGKIPGLSLKTLSGDLTTNPTAATGNVKLTLGGSDIDADFVVFDGILYATLTPNQWSDFGPAADIYDPAQVLNRIPAWPTCWRISPTQKPKGGIPSTARTPSASAGRYRHRR